MAVAKKRLSKHPILIIMSTLGGTFELYEDEYGFDPEADYLYYYEEVNHIGGPVHRQKLHTHFGRPVHRRKLHTPILNLEKSNMMCIAKN